MPDVHGGCAAVNRGADCVEHLAQSPLAPEQGTRPVTVNFTIKLRLLVKPRCRSAPRSAKYDLNHLTIFLIPYMVLDGGGKIQTVLDTNIIFAGLYSIRGASFQVLQALIKGKIQPVLSVALLFEYEDVLKRNSRKLGITYSDIDSFLDNICKLGFFQKIYYLWRPFLPDSKDDHLLELAVASQVNNISTFNSKDFKGIDQFGVKIITPKQLLEEIKWEH